MITNPKCLKSKEKQYLHKISLLFCIIVVCLFVFSFSSATGTPPDTEAPTVPANLTATAISSSQINLTWNASTDNIGVTGYKIFRDSSQVGTSVTTSFSDTGLSASTTYTYTVSAYDAAGNESGQSISVSAITQPPATETHTHTVPANLQATAISSSQIILSWSALTDNIGVIGYNIYRNGTQLTTTTNTSYSDIGLSPSTTYNYTVSAYDAAGNESGQSIASSATTLSLDDATLPTPPSNFSTY
jgi:chitodextrinase